MSSPCVEILEASLHIAEEGCSQPNEIGTRFPTEIDAGEVTSEKSRFSQTTKRENKKKRLKVKSTGNKCSACSCDP
jgi:hypothetical protein